MLKYMKVIGFNLMPKPLRHQSFLYFQRYSSLLQDSSVKSGDFVDEQKFQLNENRLDKKSFANIDSIPLLLKEVASSHKHKYALNAIDLLSEWNKERGIDVQDVLLDENYKKFVSILEKNGVYIRVEDIIKALRNLLDIGFPSDNFLIESLENDLLWNIRKVSISSLLAILVFQRKHMETDKQKKVLEEAVSAIERLWTELAKPKEFLIIYSLSNNFSDDFLKNVDDILSEKAVDFNVHSLADLIMAISYCKRRTLSLLRSLSYQMFKNKDPLSPEKTKSVLYALDSLNFYDEALLGKLSTDFIDHIKYVKDSSIIGTIAYCVGHMHWKDDAFLNGLIKWVINNINICKPKDIVSLIITLATLHHKPDNIEEIISLCIPKIDFSVITKNNLIDLVWSLTVLDQVTNKQLESVLEPSFSSDFSINNPSCVGSFLKLLNINAAAELIYTSYNGPKLQVNLEDIENLKITRSQDDMRLHNFVVKILHNFLPPPKYVRTNVKSDFGGIIDAELIVDKNCKPLDLTDYPSNLIGQGNNKTLPKGAHRVAIMVWNYKDYNKGSMTLTGLNAFTVKLLNMKGYKVVEIPYSEVNKNEKSLKNVQKIEREIRECVSK